MNPFPRVFEFTHLKGANVKPFITFVTHDFYRMSKKSVTRFLNVACHYGLTCPESRKVSRIYT